MDFENKKLGAFLSESLDKASTHKGAILDVTKFEMFPVAAGQCFYVFNWKKNEITFQKGVKRLLGYSAEDLDLNLFTSFIHPDDLEIVSRITQGSINHCINNAVPKEDYSFYMTCRIRKKNGDYIKVLRQSGMLELDDQNRMISNFSILTDISFIESIGNKVNWHIEAPKLNVKRLKKYVYEAFSGFFTRRELELLKLLNKGMTSRQIAETLYISVHTVETHRRKMLNKTGSKNLVELINFSKNNSII